MERGAAVRWSRSAGSEDFVELPSADRGAAGPGRQARLLTVLVAVVAAMSMAVRYRFVLEVTPALLVSVALAPAWLGSLARYRGMRTIVAIGVFAVVSGVLVTMLDTSHSTSSRELASGTMQLATIVAAIGVLLWCREVVGLRVTTIAYGFGLLLNVVSTTGINETNALKFSFSLPITILALGFTHRATKRGTEVLVLGVLAAWFAVFADSRSLSAMLLVTMVLTFWQARQGHSPTGRPRPWLALLLIGLLTAAMYQFMQSVILDGALGEAAKDRSQAQIDASGSLLTGGRPELGAAFALILRQPWGYGSGVLPSGTDLAVAKNGMHALNYDPNNGYVTNYMFGSGFEVHSVLGDLWIRFGIVGAIFAIAMAAYCVYATAVMISTRSASALTIFLAAHTAWDLFFSPIRAASYTLVLAVAALALLAPTPDAGGGGITPRGRRPSASEQPQ